MDREFVVSDLTNLGCPDSRGHMLLTDRYKVVVFDGGECPEELFDLEFDRGEVSNLVRKPLTGPALDRLREQLAAWIARRSDSFRIPGDQPTSLVSG